MLEWVTSSPPGGLPDPEMELASVTAPALQVDSLPLSETRSVYMKPTLIMKVYNQ